MERVIEIASQINALSNELSSLLGLGTGTSAGEQKRPAVFDLQPLGFTQLGAVEDFRDELIKEDSVLSRQFAPTMPRYWFVQDQEDYVTLTTPQQSLQDANCSTARFTMSLMGSSSADDTLWRTWWPAKTTTWKKEAGGFVQEPILDPEGNSVYAIANDARLFSGEVTKVNPRVKDMEGVVRAAYAFFVARNKDSTHDLSELGGPYAGQGGG